LDIDQQHNFFYWNVDMNYDIKFFYSSVKTQ